MLFDIDQSINVFVIGVWDLGSALLKQIYLQQIFLKKKLIDLQIYAIANSLVMLIDIKALMLDNLANSIITI
ncbi:MAG: hypothetical protein ACTS73_07725 [Arsenophonus sp. NEOnobi-MAG3]